ncbi:MAG TPA: GNAT family N-acetyltransferase [Bacteroidia bacterium]
MPDIRIEPFLENDLDFLVEIQPPDWKPIYPHYQYYLSNDSCLPLKVMFEGNICGVGTVIFHEQTAWLAHIIIHPLKRNLGLGKLLTSAMLENINSSIYKTVYLMSTDLGFPIYQSLGFVTEDTHLFFFNDDFASDVSEQGITDGTDAHLDDVLKLDHQAYGEYRKSRIVEGKLGMKVFLEGEKVRGFYLPSLLEGPVVAATPTAGMSLLNYRLKTENIVILPESNSIACQYLIDNDFQVTRKARRMRLGTKREHNQQMVYNRFSGQIG